MRLWLLSSFLFISILGHTEETIVERKVIELEWEAVPNVQSYEVRLTPKGSDTPLLFTVTEPKLSQEVPIGTYSLEVRSKGTDQDVFSPWSEAVQVAGRHDEY